MDAGGFSTFCHKHFQMANFEFLKTLQGAINFFQVLVGFMALFACSFIWYQTNLWFQFVFQGYGWQTLILAFLLITWFFNLAIFFANLFEKDISEQLGKMRLLIAYGACLCMMIIAASLESWHIHLVKNDTAPNHFLRDVWKPRFIAVTVFSWILVATYIVQILLTIFFI